jgi:hypothetical protein
MGMRYVGEQPIAKRSKRHEAARQEALQMVRSPFAPVGILCGISIMEHTSWLWPLWAFIWALVYTVAKFLWDNYRSHDPERQEKLEHAWWNSDKELSKPPPEINWEEFEDAVELRLIEADDPWAPVDTADMIYKADRDMAYVWPQGAEWACPNCSHRFNRPMDQCPLCEHITTDEERVPVAPKGPDEWQGWTCPSCDCITSSADHRCGNCGQGYRGGGPYREEVFDGPDGPVLETIHVDPRTGDRTIVSSRETYDVDQIGRDVVPQVGTSRHTRAGGTDLSSQAIGLFQIPPHYLGTDRGVAQERHHFSYDRPRSLQRQLAEEVRKGRMTREQARAAIQALHERG